MKTVSDDVQRLTECIGDYIKQEAKSVNKDPAVSLARYIATRFNRTSLYLSINTVKEQRNLKIIELRQKKKLTFNQIGKLLHLSASTVHAVVVNAGTVTITGEFNE